MTLIKIEKSKLESGWNHWKIAHQKAIAQFFLIPKIIKNKKQKTIKLKILKS